jgi:hypothetical protein
MKLEWKEFTKKSKEKLKNKKKKRKKKIAPKHKTANIYNNCKEYKDFKKPMPQYCIDGKSRRGCASQITGRTEIDLTIYSPETSMILGHKTLPDKIGEATATPDLIKTTAINLPEGFFTADAGITSPAVFKTLRKLRHNYIFAIKSNAGHVYSVIDGFEWEKRKKQTFTNEGHGRIEYRTIQFVPVKDFKSKEFDKYDDASIIFKVTSETYDVKKEKNTIDTRYFIGNGAAAKLSPKTALTYIRDHWQQESYHWVKDVVLEEDHCPTKSSNGSQLLGIIRATVVKVGVSLFSSVQTFIDHFSADPKGIYG